jgi:chromosome transmission fidelity protein 1
LTWLRGYERRRIELQLEVDPEGNTPSSPHASYTHLIDEDEPVWMLEHARQEKGRLLIQQKTDFEARLAKIRVREKRQKEIYENGEPKFKKSVCGRLQR